MDQYRNMAVWEARAFEAVTEALERLYLDEVRGVVRLAPNHAQVVGGQDVTSLDDLSAALVEVYNVEFYGYVPFDGGAAVFQDDAVGIVTDRLGDEPRVTAFFERHQAPPDTVDLISAGELIAPGASRIIRVSMEELNEELIAHLAAHPEKMRSLSPRKFEELVAEMLASRGYKVELTRQSRDGGLDIMAARKDASGTVLLIVECKRYAAQNRVGVEVVRGLYGVVEQRRATRGVVATTSYFTKGAVKFRDSVPYRMGLADFDALRTEIYRWKRGRLGPGV